MIVSVVTWPILAGQSVTVAAQLVIVYTVVVETVIVVFSLPGRDVVVGSEVSVAVTGQTVVYKSIVTVVTFP